MGKEALCTPESPCNSPECIECLIRETQERIHPKTVGGMFTANDNLEAVTVRCTIMHGTTERQKELASLTLAALATMFHNAGALALPNFVIVEVQGRKR